PQITSCATPASHLRDVDAGGLQRSAPAAEAPMDRHVGWQLATAGGVAGQLLLPPGAVAVDGEAAGRHSVRIPDCLQDLLTTESRALAVSLRRGCARGFDVGGLKRCSPAPEMAIDR